MFMNPPFPRPAEPPVKPQYIVLFKGDDSDFEGNQSVDIVIDTELDTTGMKAHFRFMDFVQDFDSIPENKTLSLVFPNAKTSEFPLGAADATLRFEDASGKFRTVSNRIHIVVTNSVHEAYDNENSQSITVTVKGTVTWDMIEGKPVFADVATSGSYNDLSDKPTIPAPVTIDPSLSPTSENPVQNKVVTKALYTGFTEWVCDSIESGYTFVSCVWGDYMGSTGWICIVSHPSYGELMFYLGSNQEATSLSFDSPSIVITRHLITPTRTSQLTNDSGFLTQHQDISSKLDGAAAYPAWEDKAYVARSVVSYKGRLWRALANISQGDPDPSVSPDWEEVSINGLKQDALSSAQIGYINAVPNKADKAVPSAAGNLAALNAQGNIEDSGVKASDFAAKADLPYAMVTPGEWEFSGSGYDSTKAYSVEYRGGYWYLSIDSEADVAFAMGSETDLSLEFDGDITATRASLPGHLLDRANNLIDATTGNVTLTLPQFEAGKVRDLLVACTIGLDSNDEPWSVIFQGQGSEAPSGADEISFKAEGDDAASATFPVPDAAGDWWYSLTERAPHVFAVSLKQLQSVSQPTQGGS